MIEFFLKLYPTLPELLKTEFNRGYIAAVGVMLAICVVLLILRIALAILFRVKRCRHVLVERKDGDIVISSEAVENAVRQGVSGVSGFSVTTVKILSSRKRYWIDVVCSYDGRDGNLPTLTAKLRGRLQKLFNEFFGVGNVEKINFRLAKLDVPRTAFQPVEEPPHIAVPPKVEVAPLDTFDVKPAAPVDANEPKNR